MTTYAILSNPGHNRVYFKESKALSLAELTLGLESMKLEFTAPQGRELGGAFYVVFGTESPLNERELRTVARLSFVYALFELMGEGEALSLRPISMPEALYMDASVSSILKYSGKTNELFTRLLINAALFSADPGTGPIRLLDPVAGKGTTLFEALALGFDAYGVELSEKSVTEGFTYLKKYLETEKYKHTTASEKINLADKSINGKRFSADISRSKAEQKAGITKHFELVAGNSMYADRYFKKNSFHIIAGDLPYGVQHGNIGAQAQKGGSLTRSPKELVSSCAGAWHTVLKPGGALALAWNSFVFSRGELAGVLEEHGFRVLTGGVYDSFEHRVDQAIRRDIIVGVK